MKLLSTEITDKNGEVKKITVCVDDATAAALAECSEDIRHIYIMDEYEAQKLTHKETRRHISYEQITDSGLDIASPEDSPMDRLARSEENARLFSAMDKLTDKQYRVLWRHAVDGLTYEEIAAEMGIRWDTVREHYHAAVKKVQKNF